MKIEIELTIGVSTAVLALINGLNTGGMRAAPVEAPKPTAAAPTIAVEQSGSVVEASPAATDDGEVDAHGHPWNAELHAATKGKTKDGLWRMKVGVVRPDPVAGFTAAPTTSTTEAGTESAQATSAPTEAAAPTATSTDEDDEFAAFRDAAASAAATDDAAKASVPARKWTDADLGALCNQAAVKLGDPTPVKELIAKFIPEGEVAHSRNIPEENRADFAKAVEAKAEIEFAG